MACDSSYQVHDMEMMIRLSHEFGFKIAAFHHGNHKPSPPLLVIWQTRRLLAPLYTFTIIMGPF